MEPTQARLRSFLMIRQWLTAALAAAAVATSLPAGADVTNASRIPYLPIPEGAAVILNTGSTNSSGYRIVVQPDGAAEYVMAGNRATATITTGLAATFFTDLRAAAPLDRLPSQPCMKSVSFGTSLFVWWWAHGRSPDLTCPSGSYGAALRADAEKIAQELDLARESGPVMRPLMPGEQHKPLPPSPSPSPT